MGPQITCIIGMGTSAFPPLYPNPLLGFIPWVRAVTWQDFIQDIPSRQRVPETLTQRQLRIPVSVKDD